MLFLNEDKVKTMTVYAGKDELGRHFVASHVGAGKSTFLKGIAASHNYAYLNTEETPVGKLSITCEQFKSMFPDAQGIVLECPNIEEFLTDFKTYVWDIPFWYSIQIGAYNHVTYEKMINCSLRNVIKAM